VGRLPHSFLTSAIYRSEWSIPDLVAVPTKEPSYPLKCIMLGLRDSLYLSVEK